MGHFYVGEKKARIKSVVAVLSVEITIEI